MAFNLCTFTKYNAKCLKLLINGATEAKNLKCWIRNDIAHFIKSIVDWNCWTKSKDGKDCKLFYILLIGYLVTIRDFQIFTRVVKLIFKVASSEFETKEVQDAMAILIRCIENHEFCEGFRKTVESTIEVLEPQLLQEELPEQESADKHPDAALLANQLPDDDPSADQPQDHHRKLGHNSESKVEERSSDSNKEGSNKKKTDIMSVFIEGLRIEANTNQKTGVSRFCSRNRFNSPKFEEKFAKLLRYFPTWSGLMQPLFKHHEDTGTSARSETYFAETKRKLVPKGSAPKRLDKFFAAHCKKINISLTKVHACLNELASIEQLSRSQETDELEHISAIENWRNKATKSLPPVTYENEERRVLGTSEYRTDENQSPQLQSEIIQLEPPQPEFGFPSDILPPCLQSAISHPDLRGQKRRCTEDRLFEETPSKKPKKGTYTSKNHEIRAALQRTRGSGVHKSYMRNTSALDPISINNSFIRLLNSCPFDSLSEVFRNGYVVSRLFQKFIDDNSLDNYDNFFKFLSIYANQGTNQTVYSRRGHILHSLYKNDPRANRNHGTLNCAGNPLEVAKGLLPEHTGNAVFRKCLLCSELMLENRATLNVGHLDVFKEGFQKLNEKLEKSEIYILENKCPLCSDGALQNIHIDFGSFIIIDVQDFFAFKSPTDEHYQCSLEEIPEELILHDDQYILAGAIEHRPLQWHYVPYCRFAQGRWDRRDNISKKPQRYNLPEAEIKKKRIFNCFTYFKIGSDIG